MKLKEIFNKLFRSSKIRYKPSSPLTGIENELCDYIYLYNTDSRWDEIAKNLYEYIQKGQLKEINPDPEMNIEKFAKEGVPQKDFSLGFETIPNKVKYALFRWSGIESRIPPDYGFMKVGVDLRELKRRGIIY